MPRWVLPPAGLKVTLADGVALALTARSIAVDDDRSPTPPSSSSMDRGASQLPDEGFDVCDALVGEMRAADGSEPVPAFDKDQLQWYRGQLLKFDENRKPCTRDQVASMLLDPPADAAPCTVFLRVGESTFRLCAVEVARNNSVSGLSFSEIASPMELSTGSAAAAGQQVSPTAAIVVGVAEGTTSASPSRRANDRYTSAVAFEFVTNVISNVIGEDLYETTAETPSS
jgi:hypothetical protein